MAKGFGEASISNQKSSKSSSIMPTIDCNEITAIPALLELLDISGCIITIDAMGTQIEIAHRIP